MKQSAFKDLTWKFEGYGENPEFQIVKLEQDSANPKKYFITVIDGAERRGGGEMIFDEEKIPLTAAQRSYYNKVYSMLLPNKKHDEYERIGLSYYYCYWRTLFNVYDSNKMATKEIRLYWWDYYTKLIDEAWNNYCVYEATKKLIEKFNLPDPYTPIKPSISAAEIDSHSIWYGSGYTEWEWKERHSQSRRKL